MDIAEYIENYITHEEMVLHGYEVKMVDGEIVFGDIKDTMVVSTEYYDNLMKSHIGYTKKQLLKHVKEVIDYLHREE